MSGAEVQIRGAKISIISPVTTFNTLQTIDYPTLVALGLISGHKAFYKIGFSAVIPSTTFMILSNVTSASFISNFPSVAQQMQLVSTSVNDTAAGTGAQQITIDYLTSPTSATRFTRFSEVVTLNGTIPVDTIATNIDRIERVHVSRVGTGSVSAGDISLQSVGGATTFEKISAGENVARTAVHFVPNGYMSIITDISVGSTTSGGTRFSFTDVELNAAEDAVRVGLLESAFSAASSNINFNTPIVLKNDKNKRISFAITVRGLASNQSGTGSFVAIDILL